MRVLVENYGEVRIFSDRPFGYKRYHVDWRDGTEQMYSGLWYTEDEVKERVESQLNNKQYIKGT
jgi:hypothetical protein